MPYRDYEQQKKRSRDLYHHRVHGTPAPPLRRVMTPEERRNKRLERSRTSEAKEKHRNSELLRLYGISWDTKVRMYEEQNGLCGFCGKALISVFGAHVDHNHSTGEVRKLLHKQCNSLVAVFEDDPKLFQTLANYLRLEQANALEK